MQQAFGGQAQIDGSAQVIFNPRPPALLELNFLLGQAYQDFQEKYFEESGIIVCFEL